MARLGTRRRRNLDAISPIDWRTVQIVALAAALLLASAAFNSVPAGQ